MGDNKDDESPVISVWCSCLIKMLRNCCRTNPKPATKLLFCVCPSVKMFPHRTQETTQEKIKTKQIHRIPKKTTHDSGAK